MAKKKPATEIAADKATVERFERALRKALSTPPEAPRKKAKAKRKRTSRSS